MFYVHWVPWITLTVTVSSSENSFLNFPGIFCRDENRVDFFQTPCTSSITVRKIGYPYLPCLTEAANSCSVQAHDNGKETVEVPLSFTAIKDQWSTQFSYFQGHSLIAQTQTQFINLPLEGAACHANLITSALNIQSWDAVMLANNVYMITINKSLSRATNWAAILMNFLISWTLLQSVGHSSTSVITHSWTSLQRCSSSSNATVWPALLWRLKVK